MNKREAKDLVFKTFEHQFEEAQFTYFIKNLLNDLDESKKQTWAGSYIKESFRDAIQSYKRLGQYSDTSNNEIDVLIVKVKKDITLERARTLQRNFVAHHLKTRNHEAALVAFHTEDSPDWRFSLVKMEFNLTKTKVEIELSPARRYSFLVGGSERSHTAQSQFQKILLESENPTLDDIEHAFNIEVVTKEFFLEYRYLFIRVKLALDDIIKKDEKLKKDFKEKNINSVDFSKKLLGQIIFLYFLQKKGWFGVERDDDWGRGSKHFLRQLFLKQHADYTNFYNDILEPLFYEALRIDRGHDDHYYSRFDCKIPFLNGGLFDPIGNYDWVHTDIILPNDLFSNSNVTKEGDVGNGILDIFDRYNFTVIEDEPLEKEVAIDPELLGKAYEKFNAIRADNFDEYLKALQSGKKGEENKFNKQYGVYYTPREIVHYMCREALINYLASEFDTKTDSYEQIGNDQLDALGNQTKSGQLDLETENRHSPYIPKEDIETFINYGELLGENEAVVVSKGKETETYSFKLPESIRKNAEVIDEKLANVYICDPAVGSGAFPVGMMHEIVGARNLLSLFIENSDRLIYRFKRECIERSLYGVDIDSGAVEIAKLRLWLSLVVDEDSIENIKPLPNLDYKFVCGNSLLSFPYRPQKMNQIEELKQKYLFETNPRKKNELKQEIDSYINKLFAKSKELVGHEVTIDFKINFSEVFEKNKGFDIVLGNPPYIRREKIDSSFKNVLKNEHQEVYNGTADIYVFFFNTALRIVKSRGTIIFITLNKYLKTKYGLELRNLLRYNYSVPQIIDFFEQPIFEAATDSAISLINNHNKTDTTKYFPIKTLVNIDYHDLTNGQYLNTIKTNTEWIFVNDSQKKIFCRLEENSIPLKEFVNDRIYSGIKTAYNPAFVLEKKIAQQLLGSESKILLKKYAKSTDIKKWHLLNDDNYFLATGYDTNIEKYTTAYRWLKKYEEELKSRQDQGKKWYNLRACAYYDEFDKNKILYMHTAKNHEFFYDTEGRYINNSCYMIITESKYLHAFLNSKLFDWYKRIRFVAYGDAEEAGRVKLDYNKMITVPIKRISDEQEQIFAEKYDVISTKKKVNPEAITKKSEDELDLMIYKIYDLEYEEVEIIEPKIEKIISKEEYEKFEIAN